MTTDDLTKGSTDGKTAAATELESELGIIFDINGIILVIVLVVSILVFTPIVIIFSSLGLLWRLFSIWLFSLVWGYFVSFYFSEHLDLEEGYRIRRWCRKKLVAFSAILPGQDRSRINKVVFLLEEEEQHRYLSRRTTKDADAALTELEWELKIIFEENSFYAGAGAALCMSIFVITALMGMGAVLSHKTTASLVLWFMILFWILLWASVVNYNFRGPLDLGERAKWLRKKIVACSVILPYQDRSRINKALLLMDKEEEEEEPQKVEQQQEQEHSKV